MGCFSFLCKESGKAVLSNSFTGDKVRLYLLKDGKVIDAMCGDYDSYGRVFKDVPYDGTLRESIKWDLPWEEVCDLMFLPDTSNGIAAILESEWSGKIPTTRSENDPNQGWG